MTRTHHRARRDVRARTGVTLGLLLTTVGCDPGSEEDFGDTEPCVTARAVEVEGCAEIVGVGMCGEGRDHIPEGSEARFESNPPHSGAHYPDPTFWGIHSAPVPRGTWVHNLEHGGIVFAYNCQDCDAELDAIQAVMESRPELRLLLTEDPELEASRFAAVAWTWVYTFDDVDQVALTCFVDQHEGHAPEDL